MYLVDQEIKKSAVKWHFAQYRAVPDLGCVQKLPIFTNLAQTWLWPKCSWIFIVGQICKMAGTLTAMFHI
jgi:hypothetical protein